MMTQIAVCRNGALACAMSSLRSVKDAARELAALRIELEPIRVACAHGTQKHYEVDPAGDWGIVQNRLQNDPLAEGGWDPEIGRLTAKCALAHLLEALWSAEEELLQLANRPDANTLEA
jgi:hypothetical protein